jgi:hypothetical protein
MQAIEETNTTKKQTKTSSKKKTVETKLEENNVVNLIVEENKNVEQNDNIQLQNENTNDSDIDLAEPHDRLLNLLQKYILILYQIRWPHCIAMLDKIN